MILCYTANRVTLLCIDIFQKVLLKKMTLHVYYAGLMNKYKQNHLIYVTHKLFNRII